MRIIGIDPGSVATGWGIIEKEGNRVRYAAAGCIRGKRPEALPRRLSRIHDELAAVFDEYRPDEAAVEGVFFCKDARAAIRLGEARGVALLVAGERGVRVFEYAPRRVKQAVIGRGGAGKMQVQHMVKNLLSLDEVPRPHDAADALAVALCHAFATGPGGKRRAAAGG